MTKITTLVALALALPLMAACETRPLTCGEYPAEGGPAIVRTRDQQVCEAVRMRVIQHLSSLPNLDTSYAEDLTEKIIGWRFVSSLEDLYERAEKDGGPELANAVRRGVESVRAETAKPVSAECEKELEKCLVAGAVKGAELAMGVRGYLTRGKTPTSDGVPAGSSTEAIDLEEMAD